MQSIRIRSNVIIVLTLILGMTIGLTGIMGPGLPVFSQEIQHEAIAINIEVPVRVFKGDTFIDDLTVDDFEVYENGVLQKIDALYLIKKTAIKREESELPKEEARKVFAPKVSRHFVLLFEVNEWLPKLGEAIEYFFENVFVPGDTLNVVTPRTTYNYKSDSLEKLSKKIIAAQLSKKLRRDTMLESAEYRNLIKEIEDLFAARDILDDVWENQLSIAQDLLRRLEDLRYVDEQRLLQFAEYLKQREGQKIVFLFYQKEMLPQFSPKYLNDLSANLGGREDLLMKLTDLTAFYRRDITFDVNKVKQSFSDSSISIHFMFITKTHQHSLDITRMDSMSTTNIRYVEQSEDIFSAFKEVAEATGGLTQSSFNASFAFKKAADASENYYLLYYSPKNYKMDGEFKDIKIRLKGKKYKVTHRAGYFAN